jgi:hypothetical protein
LSIRAELLENGGSALWDDFMNDLRNIHIADPIGGANGSVTSPVLIGLTDAFLEARANLAVPPSRTN